MLLTMKISFKVESIIFTRSCSSHRESKTGYNNPALQIRKLQLTKKNSNMKKSNAVHHFNILNSVALVQCYKRGIVVMNTICPDCYHVFPLGIGVSNICRMNRAKWKCFIAESESDLRPDKGHFRLINLNYSICL